MFRNFRFKKEYIDTRDNIVIKLLEKYGTELKKYSVIQRSPYLSLDDIKKYFNSICPISVAYNQNIISDDFIKNRVVSIVMNYNFPYGTIELNSDNVEEYLKITNIVFKNPTFTMEFIDKYVGEYFYSWNLISSNPNLTPEFIKKYKNKLDWCQLSQNPCLTLPLIYLYIDKINWIDISNNINIDEAFICKYIDRLCMARLSANPAFTMDLVEKFKDRVCWRTLSFNPNLTEPYIDKYLATITSGSNQLICNPNINTLELFDKYIEDFKDVHTDEAWQGEINWDDLRYNKFLYDDTVFSREITRDINCRRLSICGSIDIVDDIKNYILKYYIGYF